MPKDKGRSRKENQHEPLEVTVCSHYYVVNQAVYPSRSHSTLFPIFQMTTHDTIEHEYKEKRARKLKMKQKKKGLMSEDVEQDFESDEEIVDTTESFVPAALSKKILMQAREQQLQDEFDPEMTGKYEMSKKRMHSLGVAQRASNVDTFFNVQDDDEDEEDEAIGFDDDHGVFQSGDYIDMNEAQLEMDSAEAEILRRFMPDDSKDRRTLAQIIMEKMKETTKAAADFAQANTSEGGMEFDDMEGVGGSAPLDPKIVEVYTEIGRYLASYRSGKIPKVFKVVPALSNWEEILFLTNPETWTPHATYAATRLFASNLNATKAQRFYNLILLPKCRDDIYTNKRLNFHLYLALKKATYKPAGFYRGIILPLATGGDCTLREALIFGSVIAKSSIPQLHSAAALIKLASMPYSGAVSIFMRYLINKKYTLPYMAIDKVVDHFLTFEEVPGPLPVIWHQSLLALAQRYKHDITIAQKERLRKILSLHHHHGITPEVRRELYTSSSRGEPVSVITPGASNRAPVVNVSAAPVLSRNAPKQSNEMEY